MSALKKVRYRFVCSSCNNEWLEKRNDIDKCPKCGSVPKLIGFMGSITPHPEEDVAYA